MLLEPYRDELDLRVIPSKHTTTLSTRGAGAKRSQRLLAWAGPIVEALELNTAILHLAPIAREIPLAWGGKIGFLGITPQGLVRHWEQSQDASLIQLDTGSMLGDIPLVPIASEVLAGEISPIELDPESLPKRFEAAVISELECHDSQALFAAARVCGAHVAVTAGSRPTTVHLPESDGLSVVQTTLPPLVALRDDLGAGDVFAAAFFIALAHGRGPLDAATYGNAAAAVRIAGMGPNAIGRRAQVEAILSTKRPELT